jgi:hypothetical protein
MKKLILLSFLVTFHYPLFSQLSLEGNPLGLDEQYRAWISEPVWIEMEEVDVDALIEEDKLPQDKPAPFRFGVNLYVDLNPENSGVWDVLYDGSKLWRLGILSRGAVSINLAFNRYRLPKGARLFVYTPDGTDVIGAFSELNNQDDGYFATDLVRGDRIIIEYYEPVKVDFPGVLNLWRVTHGYRGPYARYPVDCDENDPWNCLNGLFSTYPNPASNYLEIDIDNVRADKLNLGPDREFTATITNTTGIVKYTDRLRGFPHRINTGNLNSGVYIINISYEGYSFSKRVMIDN